MISHIRYAGGYQNYDPFFGPSYNTTFSIEGTQKKTLVLTTTHLGIDTLLEKCVYVNFVEGVLGESH